jgi:hypothetical protein
MKRGKRSATLAREVDEAQVAVLVALENAVGLERGAQVEDALGQVLVRVDRALNQAAARAEKVDLVQEFEDELLGRRGRARALRVINDRGGDAAVTLEFFDGEEFGVGHGGVAF